MIFNSFLIGVFMLMASWLVAKKLSSNAPELFATLKSHFPIKQEYFGTCVGSLILAILFTEASNLVISKDRMVSIAIAQMGNEFERLCESCYRNLDLIQVTLKNDKCYVGLLKVLPVPSHSSHIRMLPMYSGYRDKATKRLEFTTQYLDVYATYVENGEVFDIRDITSLVIRIDEIVTATKFDVEMYDRFKDKETDVAQGQVANKP